MPIQCSVPNLSCGMVGMMIPFSGLLVRIAVALCLLLFAQCRNRNNQKPYCAGGNDERILILPHRGNSCTQIS